MLPDRRHILLTGLASLVLAPVARATPDEMVQAIKNFTKGAPLIEGRVLLDVPPLTENGNSVPLTVSLDSPMTPADHVKAIAVFNEKNPQPSIATAYFTPRSGRATFTTRMRLADSQIVTAVAHMSDGRYFVARADVLVTLAACLEN